MAKFTKSVSVPSVKNEMSEHFANVAAALTAQPTTKTTRKVKAAPAAPAAKIAAAPAKTTRQEKAAAKAAEKEAAKIAAEKEAAKAAKAAEKAAKLLIANAPQIGPFVAGVGSDGADITPRELIVLKAVRDSKEVHDASGAVPSFTLSDSLVEIGKNRINTPIPGIVASLNKKGMFETFKIKGLTHILLTETAQEYLSLLK